MAVRIASKPGENPDRLIQRFKKAISKEGVLKEIRKRKYYEKPSQKRRREAKERVKAIRKSRARRTRASKR